jgi:hypothetical protein
VIGISAKDPSAILPGGRHANAAYWFNTDNGNMVSSTYYFEQVPQWVANFNQSRLADKWFGAHWDRLLNSEEQYLKRAGKDDVPWENQDKSSNDTNYFPHVVTGGATTANKAFYRALDYTPFSNDLLVAFAKEAITNEHLGADEDPDVLSISFSANDYVGHRFGPYSQEAMDIALRVDRPDRIVARFYRRSRWIGEHDCCFHGRSWCRTGAGTSPFDESPGRPASKRGIAEGRTRGIEGTLRKQGSACGRLHQDVFKGSRIN